MQANLRTGNLDNDVQQSFEVLPSGEEGTISEGSPLSREEMLDLVMDLCSMTNRLCGFSKKSAEVVLSEKRRPSNLAKLLFVMKCFRELVAVAEEMITRPRREIVRKRCLVPISNLFFADSAVATEMVKQGYPERVPQRIVCEVKLTSLATYEMRFLMWFVLRLIQYLNFALPQIQELGEEDEDGAKWSRHIRSEVQNKRQRLFAILARLEDMGLIPISYPEDPPLSFSFHPIFSKLWRLFRQFEGMILPKPYEKAFFRLSEQWRLYELWCFLSIVFALEKYWDKDTCFALESWLWPQAIMPAPYRQGEPLEIAMKGFWICYQERFDYYEAGAGLGSLSTPLVPDICLISENRQSLLIFDAKFKRFQHLVGGSQELSSFGDIHKYRDAIVWEGKKCVWGAFLLAPNAGRRGAFKPFDWEWKTKHRFGAVEMRPRTSIEALREVVRLVELWIEGR